LQLPIYVLTMHTVTSILITLYTHTHTHTQCAN